MGLTIHPMNLGDVTVDSSFLVWATEAGTPAVIPCISHLILGAEAPIMVDGGYRDAEELVASSGFPFVQKPEQKLEASLERFDLKPADIETVVFTHLHMDHTGSIGQMPNARFLIQRKEMQYAAAPYFPTVLYDRVDIANLVGPMFDRIDFLEGDGEIAPGIRTVVTGGHSLGHQMLEVDVDSGLAMITGDIAYRIDPGVTQQVPSGYTTSIPEAMIALGRIKRDADHILPMHDGSVFTTYPDGVS